MIARSRTSLRLVTILLSLFLPLRLSIGETYNIDLTQFESNSAIFDTGVGVEGIGYGFETPFLSFNPGDVINFGSIELGASIFGDQYNNAGLSYGQVIVSNTPLPTFIPAPSYGPGCNTVGYPNCISLLESYLSEHPAPLEDLTYTIPAGDDGIQLAVIGPIVEYVTPLPELSTWAMLLLGFVGIGFAGKRRQRSLIRRCQNEVA